MGEQKRRPTIYYVAGIQPSLASKISILFSIESQLMCWMANSYISAFEYQVSGVLR